MAGDLTDAIDKLDWAIHQLATLDDAVANYIDGQPYVHVVEEQPEAEGYAVFAHLRDGPPPTLGLIASDFLANLQGSLDFVACQLILREGGTVGGSTYFPIHPSEPKAGVNIKAVEGHRFIHDAAVLSSLVAVQPYVDRSTASVHPLVVLRDLNRYSKHRHLPVLAVPLLGGAFIHRDILGGPREGAGHVSGVIDGSAQDGDEIDFIPYAEAPNGPPPCESDFFVEVVLDKRGHRVPLRAEMRRLLDFVTGDVFPRFTGFF